MVTEKAEGLPVTPKQQSVLKEEIHTVCWTDLLSPPGKAWDINSAAEFILICNYQAAVPSCLILQPFELMAINF